MIINELLVEKYRVQKALDQEVGYSLSRYVNETHNRVIRLSSTLGLNFKYGTPNSISTASSNKAVNSSNN